MRRLLIVMPIVLGLLLAGCSAPVISETPVPLEPEPVTEPKTPEEPVAVVLHEEPPEDMTWISPGKIMVGNFYAGARAEYPLLVHNGKDMESQFVIAYRYPSHTDKDYTKAPREAQDWVIIADSTPVIMPRETKEILIILAMPEDAVAPPKWEFWVSVMDTGQEGMVRTELCTRWLITMRE